MIVNYVEDTYHASLIGWVNFYRYYCPLQETSSQLEWYTLGILLRVVYGFMSRVHILFGMKDVKHILMQEDEI